MSNKQDGYSPRTPADLERRYKFGKTFAEMYGLVEDARKTAEEAKSAFEGLNQEQIFNLLTNFGEAQGVYRDDAGEVYINASYIKSGKLAADYIDAENLKVKAANVTGELVASQINTKDLKVLAANITGTLTAGQIDTTNLKVSAANVTGTLTIGQLPSDVAKKSDIPEYTSELENNSGYLNESGVTTIVNGIVTADYVNALGVSAYELRSEGYKPWQTVTIAEGAVEFYSGRIVDTYYGEIGMYSPILSFSCDEQIRFHMPNGRYFAFSSGDLSYFTSDGVRISSAVFN